MMTTIFTGNATQCRTCQTVQPPEAAVQNGFRCIGCNLFMCLECGCTEENACQKSCADGSRTCGWSESPGLCSFCFVRLVESQYLALTSGV